MEQASLSKKKDRSKSETETATNLESCDSASKTASVSMENASLSCSSTNFFKLGDVFQVTTKRNETPEES